MMIHLCSQQEKIPKKNKWLSASCNNVIEIAIEHFTTLAMKKKKIGIQTILSMEKLIDRKSVWDKCLCSQQFNNEIFSKDME